MKRILFIAAAVLISIAAVSCTKEKIRYAEDGETPLPKAVDLGLSVKWASCNLGASNEYQNGDYYAWGETKVKYNYTYGVYLYNGDNPEKLPKSKDVARKKLGSDWRMPTVADFKELIETINDDDYDWTAEFGTDSEGEEYLKGWRVTCLRGKIKGNNVFFPASGFMHSVLGYAGTAGFYWTSEINPEYNQTAMAFRFFDDEATIKVTNETTRCYGLPIRPVNVE
ncbi:MAG: hypothetical protein J6W09_08800 [Bacteroidales bacterium]|nr:hypothetical protein [Bacteroidales bacterium]